MLLNAVQCPPTQYSLEVIREARQLVHKGIISRQQPIDILCQNIPARDWVYFATQLEANKFLLCDRISNLLDVKSGITPKKLPIS